MPNKVEIGFCTNKRRNIGNQNKKLKKHIKQHQKSSINKIR